MIDNYISINDKKMCNVNEYLINDLHLLYGKILLLDQFLL